MKISKAKQIAFKSLPYIAILMPIACILFLALRFIPYTSDIGEFETDDAAIRASIKSISSSIKPFPIFNKYYVDWKSKETKWGATTMYIHDEEKIGCEFDSGSGMCLGSLNIEPQDIHRIAEMNGTLEDFKKLKAQN